jgi:hypothetical protein
MWFYVCVCSRAGPKPSPTESNAQRVVSHEGHDWPSFFAVGLHGAACQNQGVALSVHLEQWVKRFDVVPVAVLECLQSRTDRCWKPSSRAKKASLADLSTTSRCSTVHLPAYLYELRHLLDSLLHYKRYCGITDLSPDWGTIRFFLCWFHGHFPLEYEGVSKSFRTGRLERELQMVQLSATRCSCIAICESF